MVYVLDKHKKPLNPCTEKRARLLLERGRAVVHKMAPFTIRLKDRVAEETPGCALKIDPGSRVTGGSAVRDRREVVGLYEVHHKTDVEDKMSARRGQRRSRRGRKTRYRKPRFDNRNPAKCAACGRNARRGSRYCRPCEKAGNFVDNGHRETRLPPSLNARVEETLSWVEKMRRLLPVTSISMELVRFDTQLMQNPNISGVEYQHGTLYGYEVKEYLLEKWEHKCAYCGGLSGDPILNVEHVVPKNPARGPRGTDRISNLVVSCRTCNDAKGNLQPEEWLERLRKSGRKIDQVRAENLAEVLKQLKQPLKDVAAVNATRWELYRRLKALGLPVETGSGGLTKYNRTQVLNLPKTHYYDAVCVGKDVSKDVAINQKYVQVWTAIGRGTRKMCNTDGHGFPVSHRARQKMHFGFMTGDLVVADIPKGKYAGRWVGRVAVRASGYFDVKDGSGRRLCQGVSYRYMRVLQRADGWQYEKFRIGKEGEAPHPHT